MILDFKSSHSKVVKRIIAVSCLESTLKKPCIYKMTEGFGRQIARMKESGFSMALLADVASTLLNKVKEIERVEGSKRKKKKRSAWWWSPAFSACPIT